MMLRVKNKQSGFTIVELLIVIVVIGILAAIVIVAYSGVQARAKDAAIRSSAHTLSQAITLWSNDTNISPLNNGAGYNSTGTVVNGLCTGGGGDGWVTSGAYACSLEDILKAGHYLPANYLSSVPPNPNYSTRTDGRYTYMSYGCSSTPGIMILMYALSTPSDDEVANFNNILTGCGLSPSFYHDHYGMRAALTYGAAS